MTPARSVAASVVALGLAGTLTLPAPASAAAAFAAPQTCDRPEHYAAQSAAELLHIDRLDLGPAGRPTTSSGTTGAGAPSAREHARAGGNGVSVPGAGGSGAREARSGHGGAANSRIGGVGLGEVRTVLIADRPVNSAGAARILNGRVPGSKSRNELALQKAPPVHPKADTRRTGSKKFGPMQVGDGSIRARAVWAHGMACGNAAGDTSSAAAEISRLTIAGGGSAALVRVPEKITSRSGTALRLRGGVPQSTGSATITAGRISLVDNEVRLRVLRAPELRASMTAKGQSRVDYQPAVVEIVGKNGKKSRLSTAGDHIDITLSDEMRVLESLPSRLDPIGDLPLPQVSGLPMISRPETTPTPDTKPGSTLRIALGEVRHANKNNAIAARATAIRVTLTRNVDGRPGLPKDGPSTLVADLRIGMLEAAAVAPSGKASGRSKGSGQTSPQNGDAGHGNTSGRGGTHGNNGAPGQAGSIGQNGIPGQGGAVNQNGTLGQGSTVGQNGIPGQSGTADRNGTPDHSGALGQSGAFGQDGSGFDTALGSGALPLTGRRVVSLLIAGAVMIIAGAAAVALTARRRKRS
jgi:hypothetical protein